MSGDRMKTQLARNIVVSARVYTGGTTESLLCLDFLTPPVLKLSCFMATMTGDSTYFPPQYKHHLRFHLVQRPVILHVFDLNLGGAGREEKFIN